MTAQMSLYGDPTNRAVPKTEPMPEWLLRRLDAAGHIDAYHGATRTARASRCRTCNRPVIVGINADRAGMTDRCDPRPLTRDGEALARIAGLYTSELWLLGGRYHLDMRSSQRIQARPAATKTVDVLAEHRCSSDPLGALVLPRAPSVLADALRSPSAHLTAPPY